VVAEAVPALVGLRDDDEGELLEFRVEVAVLHHPGAVVEPRLEDRRVVRQRLVEEGALAVFLAVRFEEFPGSPLRLLRGDVIDKCHTLPERARGFSICSPAFGRSRVGTRVSSFDTATHGKS